MTALPPPASTPTARIVAARRTPIGRSHADSGALRDMRADELLAAAG